MIHGNEKDATAWILKWDCIPQMLINTGTALNHALTISAKIKVNTANMKKNVERFLKIKSDLSWTHISLTEYEHPLEVSEVRSRKIRADNLAAMVIKELLKKNDSVPPQQVDDVILGCVNEDGDNNRNIARMEIFLAGLPQTVPGETVNSLCASGMSAVINAARAILCGDGDIFIAGGVEHMTRGPYVISKTVRLLARTRKCSIVILVRIH